MISVRSIEASDRAELKTMFQEAWGAPRVVGLGHVYELIELPGLVALEAGEIVGALTWNIQNGACEFVSVNAFVVGKGVARLLMGRALDEARTLGCRRVWLITTNDNAQALTVYQKFGFRLSKLHIDAVAEDRRLKPEIPLVADNGIPIRDYLELEILL